jgi:hypothetical protein
MSKINMPWQLAVGLVAGFFVLMFIGARKNFNGSSTSAEPLPTLHITTESTTAHSEGSSPVIPVITPDGNVHAILQKEIKGGLADVKLFLNQPLNVWTEHYGEGVMLNEASREWIFGRWELMVIYTGENKLVGYVFLDAKEVKNQLTLREAKQIMASLGVTNSRSDSYDKTATDFANEGDQISGIYNGSKGEYTLTIRTTLAPKFHRK